MAAKERLSVARAAINFIVSGQGKVPEDLRDLCLGVGLSIIEAYTTLFQAGEVAPNRMSFYVLFSASVSCLYCLLVEFGPSIGLQSAGFDMCPQSSSKAKTLKSLDSAVQVLAQAVIHFPDLRGYSAALEVVVSQMQGPRTSTQAGPGQISSHVADAPLPAHSEFAQLGNLDVPQGFYNSWPVSESMYGLDWQSTGAEMWQFVEPGWLGSLNDNDMLDLQGSPNNFGFD
ncbi:unnamed protein product [Clonostachys rosea f. rosea IK726]|jgi:hypothetical protein|uniref:Uncharacterized protein n=1 Tax=Clonostachys rosea f. rosea IK726 TaxID=1349383 RepID=A0ACA9UAN2_BIOOC|nr:unnamed protein product [Clonostachys rosea f. rosea IK726]